MNTFEFLLHGLAWQCLPMRVCGVFQKFKMITHALIPHIRKSGFMSLTYPLMEIYMHLPHIVKQVANADCVALTIKRIFIRFHEVSRIASLTFNQDRLGTDTPCGMLGCVPNAIV